MKKLIAGMLLLLFTPGIALAQKNTVVVSGKVIEKETKEPIEAATIQLLALRDSSQVAGNITQEKGYFTLPPVKAGTYLLKVSFVGYNTHFQSVALSAKVPSKNIGVIALASDGVLLDEALITAEAPPVVVKADTTEYSASAYRVSAGAMLDELIKKIPGVEIDEEGKIKLNGEEIKKIMVNGKEFFGGDTEMSLKNLPADAVKKLKAYKEKSDRERQTGIKDGNETAVLNLVLKKNSGWMGNVIAGYGSKDRYEEGVNVNHFTDEVNLSFIGSANNTNGKGFSELGEAGRDFGRDRSWGGGQRTNQNGGLTYARKGKKLDLRGNVRYRHNEVDSDTESSTETFLGEESTFSNNRSNSKNGSHDLKGDMYLEWKVDSLNTISVRSALGYQKNDSWGNYWNKNRDNELKDINETTSQNYGDSRNFNVSGSFTYNHRFKKRGRNFHASVNFGYSDNQRDNFNDSYSQFFKQDSISDIERRTAGYGDNRNWGVFAMYSEPLSKHYTLSLSYNYSHQSGLSQSLVYDSINYDNRFNLDYNNGLSSRVENFYNNHYVNLSIQGNHLKQGDNYKGLLYNAGVALNPRTTESKTTIGPNAFKDLPRQYVVNWTPTLWLEYVFSQRERLRLNYRGNSEAPNMWDLQEVINVTDPMNMRYGNPNLKSSFTNNVDINYNRYSPKSMRSIYMSLYFRNTMNSVADRMTYDKETGARTYHKVNVNGNWNIGSWGSFYMPLKNKKFNIGVNMDFNYRDQVSYTTVNQKGEDWELSTTHNFSTGETLRSSYRSDKFDVSLKATFRYNSIYNSKQTDSNRETFDYTLGGDTNIRLPWDIEISTDLNWRIRDGYSGNANKDELMWNAQISKKFLKRKQAMVRVKVYDILQQQNNQYRWTSGTNVTDIRFNTLTSYCMVHLVYRFDTLGGNKSGNRKDR